MQVLSLSSNKQNVFSYFSILVQLSKIQGNKLSGENEFQGS